MSQTSFPTASAQRTYARTDIQGMPSRIRRRPVALALAGLLGAHVATFSVLAAVPTPTSLMAVGLAAPKQGPVPHTPSTWFVQNCDDSGANSLRAILQDPMLASGDIVDF